ncbi:hypothetical protein AAMO2058_000072300 [Amorphochlora amoebiformis]
MKAEEKKLLKGEMSTHEVLIDEEKKGEGKRDEDSKGGGTLFLVLLPSLSSWVFFALITLWMAKYNAQDESKQGFSWEHKNPKVFNYHPVLMTAGFGFCLTHAILIFSYPLPKKISKGIHGALHALAWVFAGIGLNAVFRFHNEQNIKNMYSSHSWLGIATVALYGAQSIIGFGFMLPLSVFSAASRKRVMKYHRYFGVATFAFALATMAMGILEKVTFNKTGPLKGSEYRITNAAIVVLMIWALSLPAAVLSRAKPASKTS